MNCVNIFSLFNPYGKAVDVFYVICAAVITNSATKAICTVSKTEMLYSEFGPVSSSTVGPPVSRLLNETVNHAVKP